MSSSQTHLTVHYWLIFAIMIESPFLRPGPVSLFLFGIVVIRRNFSLRSSYCSHHWASFLTFVKTAYLILCRLWTWYFFLSAPAVCSHVGRSPKSVCLVRDFRYPHCALKAGWYTINKQTSGTLLGIDVLKTNNHCAEAIRGLCKSFYRSLSRSSNLQSCFCHIRVCSIRLRQKIDGIYIHRDLFIVCLAQSMSGLTVFVRIHSNC